VGVTAGLDTFCQEIT